MGSSGSLGLKWGRKGVKWSQVVQVRSCGVNLDWFKMSGVWRGGEFGSNKGKLGQFGSDGIEFGYFG